MKNNNKIILSIIALIAIAVISWFTFGKKMYYQNQDFKKITGKIEQCDYVGANLVVYKYTQKDGKLFLTADKGPYIPCVLGDNEQGAMCEGLLTSLSNCKTVLDNVSGKKVYDMSVNSKIDYITANISKDNDFRADLVAKDAANYTGVRYASADGKVTFTLETEKGLQGGKFILNDNGAERKGEWVGTEGNKNVIVLLDNLDAMDKLTIKGNTIIYKNNIVLNLLKK